MDYSADEISKIKECFNSGQNQEAIDLIHNKYCKEYISKEIYNNAIFDCNVNRNFTVYSIKFGVFIGVLFLISLELILSGDYSFFYDGLDIFEDRLISYYLENVSSLLFGFIMAFPKYLLAVVPYFIAMALYKDFIKHTDINWRKKEVKLYIWATILGFIITIILCAKGITWVV